MGTFSFFRWLHSMASLIVLPNELLSRVVASLDRRSDIAAVRLVNRQLEETASRIYFARVPLYAEWENRDAEDFVPWPNDINYDARMFKNLLDSEKLKKLIQRVDIYMCNPDCVSFCRSLSTYTFNPLMLRKGPSSSQMERRALECDIGPDRSLGKVRSKATRTRASAEHCPHLRPSWRGFGWPI